ncbi:hypothetical protein PPERSA_02229 [Pseudocohnilembus persalinus]|uniref:Uncharacterized protein n=1 Tax=Pseudocohnilembus persalinus TaxID=266149 RepID=A0A0V0QKD3_PSEPJ|nr:hypothetical protein PPERSA_02229 [Pseudocohnilembus persalinus]|eukprot:KRX02739.1 hypothetical protein PPERSA_02229 [Pseudocohnilembus persalinus]
MPCNILLNYLEQKKSQQNQNQNQNLDACLEVKCLLEELQNTEIILNEVKKRCQEQIREILEMGLFQYYDQEIDNLNQVLKEKERVIQEREKISEFEAESLEHFQEQNRNLQGQLVQLERENEANSINFLKAKQDNQILRENLEMMQKKFPEVQSVKENLDFLQQDQYFISN